MDDELLTKTAERLVASSQRKLFTKADAETLTENYLALLRKREFQQKASALAYLSLAENVLFEAARTERDAWLN